MILDDLTPAQRSVAVLLAEGLAAKEVATQLGISPKTVNVHTLAIYQRTGARGVVKLANWVRAEEIGVMKRALEDQRARVAHLSSIISGQAKLIAVLRANPVAA